MIIASFAFRARLAALWLLALLPAAALQAQQGDLRFVTVDRPPFATSEEGRIVGFSIDLMRAIADDLGHGINFEMADSFPQMLGQVETGAADGAIANISITRDREARMDFSLPIYRSGLRIMVPVGQGKPDIWETLFSRDLMLAILAAFAALAGGGMLMWAFERRKQPYFDRPARQALFPSFWWALNLVVNGGFEERMPQSVFGRLFGTLLVIASLFVVSVFVAHITAATTVGAISMAVNSVGDLEGKQVGTTEGSTASAFLDQRDVHHQGFATLETLLQRFEAGDLDAVVFDGPILAYYLEQGGARHGQLLDANFRPENYGIALPSGSVLREEINVTLLRLIEDGRYDEISRRWFGGR